MSFYEFLAEQNAKRGERTLNAAGAIERFRGLANELYLKIETEWLRDAKEKELVTTGREPYSITEEQLGTYSVDAMWIDIAGNRISIIPVGTILIGTDARFDLVYCGKERMVIHGQNEWRLVNRANRLTYRTLDAMTFQQVIMDLMK